MTRCGTTCLCLIGDDGGARENVFHELQDPREDIKYCTWEAVAGDRLDIFIVTRPVRKKMLYPLIPLFDWCTRKSSQFLRKGTRRTTADFRAIFFCFLTRGRGK